MRVNWCVRVRNRCVVVVCACVRACELVCARAPQVCGGAAVCVCVCVCALLEDMGRAVPSVAPVSTPGTDPPHQASTATKQGVEVNAPLRLWVETSELRWDERER